MSEGGRRVRATATSFGDPQTAGTAAVITRTTGWRISRATPPIVVGLLLAPVLFIVPPHVPWALGTLGVGILLAVRKWRERFTLTTLDVPCPHCGETLRLGQPTALRQPHPLTCDACHHHITLAITP